MSAGGFMPPLLAAISAQALGLLILALVAAAPLPLILALLGRVGTIARRPLGHQLLVVCALWVTLESALVCLLGWLGRFGQGSMVALAAATLVAGLWVGRHHAGGPALARLGRDGLGWLASASWPQRGCVAILGATAGLLAIQLVALPVADFDSLTYLLPRVIEWYHSGRFGVPLAQFVGNPINSYPYAWLMFGLAIYRLARLCGGVPSACLGAATLAMLMPVGLINIRSAHVDLALAAFFLAAMYFSADAFESGDGASALIAIACIVIMLGTKMSGLPYAAALAGFWVWLSARRYATDRRSMPWPRLESRHVALAVVLAVAAGLAGLSWYVHNALVYGNPLGAVRVSILGRVIWDGSITSESVARTDVLHNFHVTDRRHWAIALGAAVAQLELPGLVLLLGAVGAIRLLGRRSAPRGLLLAVLGLALASFWLYLATPWSGNDANEGGITPFMGQAVRYGMPFLGLVSVLAGSAFRLAPGPLAASALVVGALVGAMAAADPWQRRGAGALKWQLIVAFLAGLLLWLGRPKFVLRLQGWTSRARVTRLAFGLVLIGAAVATVTAVALEPRHRVQHTMLGGIARFVDRELPPVRPLGFSETYATSLLYGTRFQHRLQYVPFDKVQTPRPSQPN